MKDFIKKIQSLPEQKRKIILWTIIFILGVGLFIFYFKNINQKIKSFQKEKFIEELKFPSFEKEINDIRSLDIGESLKKIEEIIKEAKPSTENLIENETK